MIDNTRRREFEFQRYTQNFSVYTTPLPSIHKKGYLYLPTTILRVVPQCIDVIIGTRTEHVCNCEYCTHKS